MVEVAVPRRVNRDSKLNDSRKVYVVPKFYHKDSNPTFPRPKQSSAMELQRELKDINDKIKLLKKRKDWIKTELKKRGQGIIRPGYFNKPIFLYILELEQGNWYVGQSRNPQKRFIKHQIGKGAKWTKLHKPISIHEIRPTGLNDDREVAILEDELTIELARRYGAANVRGGGYCQAKPQWPSIVLEPLLDI